MQDAHKARVPCFGRMPFVRAARLKGPCGGPLSFWSLEREMVYTSAQSSPTTPGCSAEGLSQCVTP